MQTPMDFQSILTEDEGEHKDSAHIKFKSFAFLLSHYHYFITLSMHTMDLFTKSA